MNKAGVRSAADSHLETPVDERPLAELVANDLIPFAVLAKDGLEAVMPAHVVYPAIDALPTGGSGLVVWDFGTAAPPTINVPPRAGDDPDAKLATEPEALAMVAAFIDRNQAN